MVSFTICQPGLKVHFLTGIINFLFERVLWMEAKPVSDE